MSKLRNFSILFQAFFNFDKSYGFNCFDVVLIKFGGLGDMAISLPGTLSYYKRVVSSKKRFLIITDSRWSELYLGSGISSADIFNVDIMLFFQSFNYRKEVFTFLRSLKCKKLIVPTISKLFWLDDIFVYNINSEKKISLEDDSLNKRSILKLVTQPFYDFTFSRISFFEKDNIDKFFKNEFPDLQISSLKDYNFSLSFHLPKDFQLIVLGAGDILRAWDPLKFIELSKRLSSGLTTVVAGNLPQIDCDLIRKHCEEENILCIINKTSVGELIECVKRCGILIANESGVVHVAANMNKKIICISNGNHYLRFHPYVGGNFFYVYPSGFNSKYMTDSAFRERVRYRVDESVNSINVDEVLDYLHQNRFQI